MLTDEVIIKVEAGKGGDGAVSFLREKYKPKGGPDGGDGGDGGDIVFEVNRDVNTLTFFDTRKEFKADDGERGGKKNCHGGNADDLILRVPPGTIVYEITNDKSQTLPTGRQVTNKSEIPNNQIPNKIADLTTEGDKFIIAKGGRGGWGNVHFASATHQTPYEFKEGTSGEEKTLKLELQLIADVGFIGLPNAGKSTLLSRISRATPKIGNYPFTTLEPNLGVAKIDDDFSFVAADIPGLIEGASHGRGLGDKFLRHVKRTKLLIHLIDVNSMDAVQDYKTIKSELKLFSPELAKKKEIVVISKADTVDDETLEFISKNLKSKIRKTPLIISAASNRGLKELLYKIKNELK